MKQIIFFIYLVTYGVYGQQFTRIGDLRLFEPQRETVVSDTAEIQLKCSRVIVNAQGTNPGISGIKFGEGNTDNYRVNLVLYNGGATALIVFDNNFRGGTGNKINCWGSNKILAVGECAELIYNSSTGFYDYFK